MDATTKPKRKSGVTASSKKPALPRPARPRPRAGESRPAHPRRPPDQQGHRDAPAGALAVPRRHRGEGPQGVPVHQRHRHQGPQVRHPGAGRRARGQPRDLPHRHRLRVRRDRRALGEGCGSSPMPPRVVEQRAVPRHRHHRQGARQAGPGPRRHPAADLDAGLGRRALHHAVAIHHPGSRHRRAEHGQLPRPGEGAAAARHEPVAGVAARASTTTGKSCASAASRSCPARWCSARRRASRSPRCRSCRRRSTSCTSRARWSARRSTW